MSLLGIPETVLGAQEWVTLRYLCPHVLAAPITEGLPQPWISSPSQTPQGCATSCAVCRTLSDTFHFPALPLPHS